MIGLVAAAVTVTQLSCVVVDTMGSRSQFDVIREDGALVIVPTASTSWPDGIIGISPLHRAEKRQGTDRIDDYRVQTRGGTYVVGLSASDKAAPTLVVIEKDDFGTPALNPTAYEGICANRGPAKERPTLPPPAPPVIPVGHSVRPITMQNTTFQTQCRAVTRDLTVSSFTLKTSLRPAGVTFQSQSSQALPAIDAAGASLAGIASPLADPSRQILRVFSSAGGTGPVQVKSQISGENGQLTQTLEVSQVANGYSTLVAAGMCEFPSKGPAERG
jgi:hypothetical protein